MSSKFNVTSDIPKAVDSWSVGNKKFTIVEARIEDAAEIIHVAQEAFYRPDMETLKQRNFSLKKEFGTVDVPRRINNPQVYKVLACKVQQGEGPSQIVGTVYYQPKNTDFKDENGKEVAELGLLAVDPTYSRVNQIGLHLIQTVEKLAIRDGMAAIYLYVKGTQRSDGTYDNALVKYYEQSGKYEFVANRTSTPQKWFSKEVIQDNQSVLVPQPVRQVLMMRDLSKQTSQRRIKSIRNEKLGEQYPIRTLAKKRCSDMRTMICSRSCLTHLKNRFCLAISGVWPRHREAARMQ